MEQVHRARAKGQEKAAVAATQQTDRRQHRNSEAPDPAGVRAGDPAGPGAKAEVPARAGVGGLEQSINQLFYNET
jgi:hypothetical protein